MRKTIEVGLITAILVSLAISVCWLGPMMVRQQTQVWEHAEDGTLVCVSPEPAFTDLVQTSLKGVVHLQCPDWQGSGFVVGPRLIATARHCAEGVEEFLISTSDGHQLRATRAISDKEHDVAFIWVDDLRCSNDDHFARYPCGKVMEPNHEVVLFPLPLGSIKDCVLGQSIYSIGSTFGKIHFNAVATGIIQTLGLALENHGLSSKYGWVVLFSNTAEGGGGNSGCPLFTLDGKVIGVWVGSKQPNVHYCVPIDVFLDDLDMIQLLFAQDRYQREVEPEWSDPYYNHTDNNDYYVVH